MTPARRSPAGSPTRTVVALALAGALVACAGKAGSDARPRVNGSTPPAAPATTLPVDSALFDYDASAPLEATSEHSDGTEHADVDLVSYVAHDGATVPGALALPKEGGAPFACIVAEGGVGSSLDDNLTLVDDAAANGFGVFTIGQRNSAGRGTPAELDAAQNDPVLLAAMLRDTVIDLRRGLDYLQTREECDPERIGYVGLSFGGFLGSLLAGADERVQAPVLVVSGADWRTFIAESDALMAGLEYGGPDVVDAAVAALDPVDPKYWIGRISPRPVLMIYGTEDEAIPPVVARQLHAAANEPKTVLQFEGDHYLSEPDDYLRVRDGIYEWFVEHLS